MSQQQGFASPNSNGGSTNFEFDNASIASGAASSAGSLNKFGNVNTQSLQYPLTPNARIETLQSRNKHTKLINGNDNDMGNLLLNPPNDEDNGQRKFSSVSKQSGWSRRSHGSTWVDEAGKIHGEGNSPIYSAIFNMLAGCGTVGLPVTYKDSGLLLGVGLMVMVAVFSVYTLRLLVKTGKKVRMYDYERLTEHCFGSFGYYLLTIAILIFDIGSCLTYSIILGDSAHDVINFLLDWDDFYYRQLIIAFCYTFLILPFCLGKNFQFIEKISAIAIFSVVIMVGTVTMQYFIQYRTDPPPNRGDIKLINHNIGNVLGALGTISFAFVQHDQTFLVFRTLYNNTLARYTKMASSAFIIQAIICISIAVFGYLSFGEQTQDDILKNYDLDDTFLLIIRIMYTFTMAFIYPTAFYVVRHLFYSITHELYHVCFKASEEHTADGHDSFEDASFIKRLVFTLIPWTFFLAVSLFLTDLGFVMSLSGLASALLIAFILPCAMYLKYGKSSKHPILFWNAKKGYKLSAFMDTIPCIFLVLFGTAAGIIGSIQVIICQINSQSSLCG